MQQGVPLPEWSAKDVGLWMEAIQLSQYRKTFVSFGVNGVALLRMDTQTLKELGVRNIGHQHLIIDGAQELQDQTFQASLEPSLPGSPPISKTGRIARNLARKKIELVEHTNTMRAMRHKLNEVLSSGVLETLGQYAKVLQMEEAMTMLAQCQKNLREVKAHVNYAEKDLEEHKQQLELQAKQAGVVLSGTADEGLLNSLTSSVVLPQFNTKSLTQEDLERLVVRLYPEPKRKERPREIVRWVPPKVAPPFQYEPKPTRKMPEEELIEIFHKFHPDPVELKTKRQAMDDSFMLEVKKTAARGTHDMAPEERTERISGFVDRYRADLTKRGIAK